jgi:Prp8 binding protein
VYCVKFSPNGRHLATAGKDKDILLWNVFGESDNYGTLAGHKNAVLDIAWSSDGSRLYSVSADKGGAIWDAETGTKVRGLPGSDKILNAVSAVATGSSGDGDLIATGGDDGIVRVYDGRTRTAVHTLATGMPVLALALALDGESAWVGGIDPRVQQWELRRGMTLCSLVGHTEPVTGLSLSRDGTRLLSAGMDHTGKG